MAQMHQTMQPLTLFFAGRLRIVGKRLRMRVIVRVHVALHFNGRGVIELVNIRYKCEHRIHDKTSQQQRQQKQAR